MSADLVLAKIQLAEARDQYDLADAEFRSAATRGAVGQMIEAHRRKAVQRAEITRLYAECGRLEGREMGIEADFGPGASEELS